jgi:hypothetical protein
LLIADCSNRPLPYRSIRQAIRFDVLVASYVGDGELEGASKFATGPMQGIEARTAADVLATHLADHNLGIGINVQSLGFQGNRILQGFHEGYILSNVVVLMANPFGDADGATLAAINNHPNTRRPRVSLGAAVHISYEFWHHCSTAISKMRRERDGVKINIGFDADFSLTFRNVQTSV